MSKVNEIDTSRFSKGHLNALTKSQLIDHIQTNYQQRKWLEDALKAADDERIVDALTIRGEWNKDVEKLNVTINDFELEVEEIKETLENMTKNRDYWKDRHQFLKKEADADAWMHDRRVLVLQARIIELLEEAVS